jgi:transposase
MISMEDWAEIRRLHRAEKMSIKAICRVTGAARNTVRAALRSEEPPRYSRPAKGSSVDVFEPAIRAQLRLDARMPATVVAQRVGWSGSITVLRTRVRQVRPEYLGVDPVDRVEYVAGDTAQCDLWFPGVPVGGTDRRLPVLVMTAAYSKFFAARLLPSRLGGDLTCGMWQVLREDFGAVPKRLWWDRESAIARTGRATDLAGAFCGAVAARLVVAPPRDPEFKGMVERRNRYLETSFLPGRVFASPGDFADQLRGWLAEVGNQRRPRSLGGATPAQVMAEDAAAMTALPPVAPSVGLGARVRLPRDYYVRLDTNDYSVDPGFVGRFVDVRADLATVRVSHEGHQVASHDRSWALRTTVTDPAHRQRARDLRRAFWDGQDRPRAARAGQDVPRRALADYDKYYGHAPPGGRDEDDQPRPRLEVVR